jgi:hypothetical protein
MIRRLGVTVTLLVFAAILFGLGRMAGGHDLQWADQAASVVSVVLSLVALAITVSQLVAVRLSRSSTAESGVPQALDDLATALRIQLAVEERQRRVHDPQPLPVRWTVISVPPGTPADLATGYSQVTVAFDRLPARRLVVLGPAGAGKSVLVTRLARDLLERREAGGPVPVILPLATWDEHRPVEQWLITQLIRDHPDLGARVSLSAGGAVSLAGVLLAEGRLLPILDGFDELPAPARESAVQAVNAYGSDQPLVLTSRPDEYHAAVAAAGRPVSQAAVVQLQPLRLAEVHSYLRDTAHSARWYRVLDRLRREPTGPLAETLTNPLLLWLARTVHEAPGTDPARLIRNDSDRATLEGYLLDSFVPAVYGKAAPRAQHRLAFLAAHVQRTGTTEFAWWHLPRALRGWLPVSSGIRAALRAATLGTVLIWLLAQHGFWQNGRYAEPPDGPGLLAAVLGGPVGAPLVPMAQKVVESGFWFGRWDSATSPTICSPTPRPRQSPQWWPPFPSSSWPRPGWTAGTGTGSGLRRRSGYDRRGS